MTDEELEPLARAFTQRQRSQLGPAGAQPPEAVQQRYEEVLAVLEQQLQKSLFFFGSRPSVAEFGLHGQLTQYAADSFVSSVMEDKAVRVFQWEQLMDDLSGIEGERALPEDCLTRELERVIATLAGGYFPMLALKAALRKRRSCR